MFKIRKIDRGDIERVLDLVLDFERYLIDVDDSLVSEPFPRARYMKTLLEGLYDEKHTFLVAEIDGRVIAFIDYWAYPEFLHGGLTGYMNNLYVDGDHRGKGIGSALVDHVMEEAQRKGIVAMHVPVKPLNRRAVEFYIRKGIDEQLVMMETRLDGRP
ncbi:MAG: GNAT family N-acetyltransferase [Thermoplasmatota archaeon]